MVTRDEVFGKADILLKVRPLVNGEETDKVKEGGTVISFMYPVVNKDVVEALAGRRGSGFAMDMIPRISRAQVFDALRCVDIVNFLDVFVICLLARWRIFLDIKLCWRLPIILVGS